MVFFKRIYLMLEDNTVDFILFFFFPNSEEAKGAILRTHRIAQWVRVVQCRSMELRLELSFWSEQARGFSLRAMRLS